MTEGGGWKGLFTGLVKKTFDNGVAPSQPVVEAAVNTTPSIPEAVAPRLSPIMQTIKDARDAMATIPTEDSAMLEVAQAEVQIQTGAIVDQARTTATEIHQNVMNARPGMIERASTAAVSTFRKVTADRILAGDDEPPLDYSSALPEGSVYDASGHIDLVFATEPVIETPEQAAVQAALQKAATRTVEPLSRATTTAEITPEERTMQYRIALAKSYDRSVGETVPAQTTEEATPETTS